MGHWYVIETNVKCEDKAERNIRRAGFEVYAPIARTEVWNKRKRVHVARELRLMPRYLFVRVEGAVPWYVIRACEGVKRALGAEGRPCQLTANEAIRLYEVMAAEQNLEFDTTREGKLRRGEIGKNKRETARIQFPSEAKITITKGPFATFSGEVITVTGQGKLKALVSVLGRMSEVEIPTEWASLDGRAEAAEIDPQDKALRLARDIRRYRRERPSRTQHPSATAFYCPTLQAPRVDLPRGLFDSGVSTWPARHSTECHNLGADTCRLWQQGLPRFGAPRRATRSGW